MHSPDSRAASPWTRTRPRRPSEESTGSSPRSLPHLELARKLRGLPRDLGFVLIGLGAIGIAIPGPIPPGASFVVLGVLFAAPGLIA